MPIYEFECRGCGRESEVLVRSSDWEGTECPHCGSRNLTKKLSVFASANSGSQASETPCGLPAGGGGCCGGACAGHNR